MKLIIILDVMLRELYLNHNNISDLCQIDNLVHLRNLTALSCLNNPITKLKNYKSYVVSRLPWLKFLDYLGKLAYGPLIIPLMDLELGKNGDAHVLENGYSMELITRSLDEATLNGNGQFHMETKVCDIDDVYGLFYRVRVALEVE